MLVLIDFQNCFLPNEVWGVPDIQQALHVALSLRKSNIITTRYIPPTPIFGAWKEYFRDFPTEMQDKYNVCYDLIKGVPTNLGKICDFDRRCLN